MDFKLLFSQPRNFKGFSTFNAYFSMPKITIPSSEGTIRDHCFEEFVNLEELTIPSSVTVNGSSAFKNCTSLKKLVIPSSVISIEDFAFQGGTSLSKITFDDHSQLNSIDSFAFNDCSSLS